MIFKLILIIITSEIIFSQEYGRGLILEEEFYVNVPRAVSLLRSDYSNLPASFSLKMFAPNPGYQGSDRTCTGWACGYSARTLLESVSRRWYKELTDSNTFSPSFVYNLIRKDSTCDKGASLSDAINILKTYGCLKYSDFKYDCSRQVSTEDKIRAEAHKILDIRLVFGKKDTNKVLLAKKSLVEYKPVVIAISCPKSFNNAGDVWCPDSSDYNNIKHSGHALVIVAYDDEKYGGAFEVLNSWGENWGNAGFTWIKYSDFQHFGYYGYELIDNFEIGLGEVDLSGSLTFLQENGKVMETSYNGHYFVMKNDYPSGTKFELFITNYQPAYIYAFATDLERNITRIFPPFDSISALLPYRVNNFAIPDNNSYNMLDEQVGKTYYCFLYSNQRIDIEDLIVNLKALKGSVWENLQKLISNNLVDDRNVKIKSSRRIEFSAVSSGKSIVALLIEIKHI